MTEKISKKRIMIVDDHPIIRKGLAQLINQTTDLKVCCEAGDAHEALEKIKKECFLKLSNWTYSKEVFRTRSGDHHFRWRIIDRNLDHDITAFKPVYTRRLT